MGLAAALVLLASASLQAQPEQHPPQTQPEQPPPQTQPEQPPPQTQQLSGDFDLLGPQKAPDAAVVARQQELTRQLSARRTMLQLHQLGGYATMASVTAAVVLGQINYLDKYAGGGDTGRWITPHAIAAFSAAGIFTATGLLALFAPSPLEKPLRVDTVTLHRVAMGVATAAMASQVVLGLVTRGKEGSLSQRDFALAHQIIGYTALVSTYAGFLVLTFE